MTRTKAAQGDYAELFPAQAASERRRKWNNVRSVDGGLELEVVPGVVNLLMTPRQKARIGERFVLVKAGSAPILGRIYVRDYNDEGQAVLTQLVKYLKMSREAVMKAESEVSGGVGGTQGGEIYDVRGETDISMDKGLADTVSKSLIRQPYKGVYEQRAGRYKALASYRGKVVYVGVYDTPEEAARARDKALLENVPLEKIMRRHGLNFEFKSYEGSVVLWEDRVASGGVVEMGRIKRTKSWAVLVNGNVASVHLGPVVLTVAASHLPIIDGSKLGVVDGLPFCQQAGVGRAYEPLWHVLYPQYAEWSEGRDLIPLFTEGPLNLLQENIVMVPRPLTCKGENGVRPGWLVK